MPSTLGGPSSEAPDKGPHKAEGTAERASSPDGAQRAPCARPCEPRALILRRSRHARKFYCSASGFICTTAVFKVVAASTDLSDATLLVAARQLIEALEHEDQRLLDVLVLRGLLGELQRLGPHLDGRAGSPRL